MDGQKERATKKIAQGLGVQAGGSTGKGGPTSRSGGQDGRRAKTCEIPKDAGQEQDKGEEPHTRHTAAGVCRPRRGAVPVCLAGLGKEARRLQDRRPPQQH